MRTDLTVKTQVKMPPFSIGVPGFRLPVNADPGSQWGQLRQLDSCHSYGRPGLSSQPLASTQGGLLSGRRNQGMRAHSVFVSLGLCFSKEKTATIRHIAIKKYIYIMLCLIYKSSLFKQIHELVYKINLRFWLNQQSIKYLTKTD